MLLIDSHSHLNFRAFDKDRQEVLDRTLAGGVWIVNVGSNFETSKIAVEAAKSRKLGVFAAVGLHPIHLETGRIKKKTEPSEQDNNENLFDYEKYRNLAKQDKAAAIGEIGLDYYWKPKSAYKLKLFKQKQKDLLLEQMKLAEELGLPIIFHCRKAHEDLIKILKSRVPSSKLQGVVHCFTGNWEQAQEYIKLGLYLGFNGIIFKLDLDEVIKKTALDRILVETDCPYLAPPVHKGKRNEPLYIKYVVQKIADLKGISFERAAETTTNNARALFKI